MSEARRILADAAEALEAFFPRLLARYHAAPERLREAIGYSLLGAGKRVRPALVLETSRACGADARSRECAVAAAAAIELIHTFSLVHDDLPAMDDDDLRRGRPTNHKMFGEALAILAGDAMVTMAMELLASECPGERGTQMIRELASASGPAGMIGGQVIDIESEHKSLTLNDLQRMHRMKTGALLLCACRLGALAAGAGEGALAAVSEYGRHIGLAFQIVDDLLDVTGSAEEVGKETGKDAGRGKNTYPGLLGVEASRREAFVQLEGALAAVEIFGDKGSGLKDLARFVVERAR